GFRLNNNAKSVRIPIEVQHNVILIPVRINKSFEMRFILDTGVKTSILTEPVMAHFLALDSMAKIKVRGLGEGDPIEADLARDVRMTLPGIEGRGINLLVLPEGIISYSGMFGQPVYGILGYELFGQFAVEINYRQKYIRVYDPFRYRPGKKWESIPINIRRSKPYVTATLVDHRGEELEAEWLLDTGASMAVSLFDDELPPPKETIEAFLGQGLSGQVYGRLGRSPQLQLGEFVFENIITGYPAPEALSMLPSQLSWYGNIGAEVISRFRVIFDYPNQRLLLRKTSKFRKPFDYNVSGLEVVSYGKNFDQFIINYVRPNSPAAKAGIQINDQILSLNGLPVNGARIEDLYGNLMRRNAKTIHLKLRRGDRIIRTSFRMFSEI
ncbi:MAG: aspartyl protease family protein, partial [Bacteroidota bacterium]